MQWQGVNSLLVTLNEADGKITERSEKFDSIDIRYRPEIA